MDSQERAEKEAPEPSSNWRRLLPIGGMSVVATALPPVGGLVVLGTLPVAGAWLQEQQWVGMGLYVLAFIVFAGLALLPTYAQAVLGGWAFGFTWGFPAALVGFAGGSLLGYAVSRSIAGDRLIETIDRSPQWRAVYQELIGASFWRCALIVTLVRLPPAAPFALTNVLMSSARIACLPYLLGTLVGLAPRTGAAVFAAAGLSRLDMDEPLVSESNWMIGFAIVSTIAVTLVIGVLARRALRRLTVDRH